VSKQRLIGFDPGSRLCGWGVIDCTGRKVEHVDNGVIVLPAKKPLSERIGLLLPRVQELIEVYKPDRAAAEQIIFVHNVRTAVALAQVRGALVAVCALAGLSMDEYGPTEVKKAVTGRGRAAKEQVAEMVMRLLGLPEVPQEDAADALAVALAGGLLSGQPSVAPRVASGRGGGKGRKAWEALVRERGAGS
jgi:crossover junction endodeoxyribonuclease RuvC